jgi:NACalpha-BTF3-like transcription factor
MVLDPVSALGVAGTVIQFVDFSSRLLSKGKEYYKSGDGALVQHKDITQAAASVGQLSNRLSVSLSRLEGLKSHTFEESALKAIVEECKVKAQELVTTLQQLQVHGKHKVWKSLRQALKSEWKKEKIQQMHQRLTVLRESMVIHLLVIVK